MHPTRTSGAAPGLVALTALALLGGCAYKSHVVPDAPVPFALSDYSILGSTNAESCAGHVFGFTVGHPNETVSIAYTGGTAAVGARDSSPAASILAPVESILNSVVGLFPFGPGSVPESSRALYLALEKMPEATHLLDPRFHTTSTGLIVGPVLLFGERCSRVDARGVKIGGGPTQNQEDPWIP